MLTIKFEGLSYVKLCEGNGIGLFQPFRQSARYAINIARSYMTLPQIERDSPYKTVA